MAAGLLTTLIDKTVTANALIKWLTNEDDEAPISDELSTATVNKSEFVPFFLNYLRGQASWLLRDTKPSSISPLKTPISAKNVKANGHFSCTSGHRLNYKTPNSAQRIQHFDSRTRENSFSSNVSYETPPQKWGARSNNTSGSLSETSFTNSTSGRRDNRRQKTQRSLGDFLSPANSGRPDRVRNDDCSPSLGGSRWLNGRGRGPSSGERWMKNSQRNEELNEPLPVFNLANADDFPAVMKSKEAPRQGVASKSRRIVPTPVSSVGQSDDPSTSFLKVVDVPAPAKVMPRSIWAKPPETISGNPELDILMKRSKALPRGNSKSAEGESAKSRGANVTPESTGDPQTLPDDRWDTPKTQKPGSVASIDVVQGNPEQVTYHEELEVLAFFYSQCIQEGLVSNVTMELYFLVQLLTVRSSQILATTLDSEGFDSGISYLSTVHNAIFFATSSLLHLHSFLSLLDRSTIRPMAENVRVSLFSPKLKDLLLGLCDQPLVQSHGISYSSPLGGVIFQPETDNRSNFPTDRSFHTFKKQRDAFYDLLRQWEEKHLCVGWSMRESQAATIRWLMDGCLPDLSNYVHLVRLFVLQLIKMCSAEGSSQGEEKDEKLRDELKEANPDKLKRLQERLTNPVSAGGICPSPSFPGCQEFFRDFITIAANHVFNQHLSDTLRSKINKLTKKSETSGHIELTDTTSAQEKHEELLQSLLMLRILGKFLGSLTFLPYRSIELPQESVKLLSIKIRNEVQQPVDVLSCLTSTGGRERMLLCVVWVVDFLSQMDFVAPELNYYQEVFGHLVDIYWSCCRMLCGERSYAFFLMATLLGWLFELKLFPEVLFYRQKQKISFCDQWIETKSHSLDVFSLIDLRILYACCPMLGELRALLVDFSAECNSSSGCVRKITPVTAVPVSHRRSKSKKDVQQRLLDGFFDMHPDSLRQTVSFVSDRVASNFVKFFQANNLSRQLERIQSMAKEEARSLFASSLTAAEQSDTEALRRLKEFAEDALEKVLEDGKTESGRYCAEKLDSVMDGLLSEETAPAVKSLASRISLSRALRKIDAWMAEKLTLDFFLKDLKAVFNHELRLLSSEPADLLLVPLKRAEQQSSAPAPTDVLSDLKQILLDLLVNSMSLNSDRLLVAVTSVEAVAFYRQDLLPAVLTHIALLSVSLACYTIFYRPDLWNEKIEQHLVRIWETLKCRPLLERITCTKHIQCFKKSSEESRTKFVDFLHVLTDKSLVKTETLDVFTRTVQPL